jgi:chaperonin cofactor prefoldin
MSQDDAEEGAGSDVPSLDGMAVDDAVEAVVAADESRDPEAVRRALSQVSEDGVVTESAVDDAVGHLSKVVATPETRVELVGIELDEAREDAQPVADIDLVAARFDEYETELAALEDRLEGIQASLSDIVDRADDPVSLYAVGRGCSEVTAEANALQADADDLKLELETDFQRWLTDARFRADRLGEDVDAVEGMLEELSEVAAALDDADEDETPTLPGGETVADPAVAWFDASLRVRVATLLLADLRAERADLRAWLERESESESEGDEGESETGREDGAGGEAVDALEDAAGRLASLDERASGLEDWLDALARPAWRDRFGDRVETFEHAVADRPTPVDWAAVQATLEEHRSAAVDAT